MEIKYFLSQIISTIAALLVYSIVKHLSGYSNEKGKNLATKEDIGKITEIIKKVEAEIKVKENTEIDYLILKRKIILEYFSTLVYCKI